jgi:hypothetical protein
MLDFHGILHSSAKMHLYGYEAFPPSHRSLAWKLESRSETGRATICRTSGIVPHLNASLPTAASHYLC